MTARGGREHAGARRVELLDTTAADDALWAGEQVVPAVATPAGGAPSPVRRRRWIVAGSVCALVALVVVADALGSPDERRSASPVTTRPAPTTFAGSAPAASATTVRADDGSGPGATSGGLPFVLASPPPGYSISSADRFAATAGPGFGQLWSTWDPASTTWLAITAWSSDGGWSAAGSARVWLTSGVGIIDQRADGTTVLDANHDGFHISIQARGVDTPALATVMDSLHVDGDGLAPSNGAADLGLRLVATSGRAEADGQPPSAAVEMITFVSANSPTTWITVQAGQPMTTFERAMRSFRLQEPEAVVVGGGHLAVVGLDGRLADPEPIAIVDVDGTEVELSGGSSRTELIYLARTLTLGTEDEWAALVDSADGADGDDPTVEAVPVGRATMRSGAAWEVSLVPAGRQPAMITVSFQPVTHDGSVVRSVATVPLGDGPVGIQAVATDTGVVLIGRAGRDAGTAELRVTVADASYHASAVDPGPAAGGLIAALGISELAPYRAELVAADGTVLATLDGT